MNPQPYLTILIPILDEAPSIAELYTQASLACQQLGRTYEILWIDDGSRDGSGAVLDDLTARDPRVRVVHFRRNFGKSAAMTAGFERARGQIVVTLDADLQDDPAMIGEFVRRVEAGADLVSGWKKQRNDPPDKTFPSRVFNALARGLSGLPLHDFACGFKAMRADCVRELAPYGGFHRLLPILAHGRGFRVEELVVNHRKRKHGRSKYGAGRYFDGLYDLLGVLVVTRFRGHPMRLFGGPGLVLAALSALFWTYWMFTWLFGQIMSVLALVLGVFTGLLAALLLGLGALGELFGRALVRAPETYSIRDEREAPAGTRAALYAVSVTATPAAPPPPATLAAPPGLPPGPPPLGAPAAADEDSPTVSRDDNPFARPRRTGKA